MSKLSSHKTRIVCTIGPASSSPETLEKMILAGMNIARLNFSHGKFEDHAETIRKIRAVSEKTGKAVAIMADLPGPKMRIGDFEKEPVILEKGGRFILTTRQVSGTQDMVSITMEELPAAVKKGQMLYLNDGIIQLRVDEVQGQDIICTVVVGGELRSRKGLNIPGIKLGTSAFTSRDHECLKFALENGVDAVSQSFVGTAQDVRDVRNAAEVLGHRPFIIAKIERSSIVDEIDEIMDESDGIMVARGDLGVEIPIEKIAIAQKFITRKANVRAKPVITATQMLESMTHNRRPTRAEATDVANAILDGTDAVMLSEESAMGDFPVEAVEMLASIAEATEPYLERQHFRREVEAHATSSKDNTVDLIALSIDNMVDKINTAVVFCPTDSGATARNVTRFRLPCWIIAPSTSMKTCMDLLFSFGVCPDFRKDKPVHWSGHVKKYVREFGLEGDSALVTEGPSKMHPEMDHRLEIVKLK
ncbi:MAG: pyruvate kinase [Thermodesulfatator sp.]|nr:MAG: pyruvate kinase [Thermodesulfatator sp.]